MWQHCPITWWEEAGVRVVGTPLWCSQDRADEVWQNPESFVQKQNPQAPSLSAAPALEQSLWGEQTSMMLCALPPLVFLFSFLCCPFYPHCSINKITLLEHGIKHLLCKTIPLKRVETKMSGFVPPPIYSYSLSICQTLNNKGKKGQIIFLFLPWHKCQAQQSHMTWAQLCQLKAKPSLILTSLLTCWPLWTLSSTGAGGYWFPPWGRVMNQPSKDWVSTWYLYRYPVCSSLPGALCLAVGYSWSSEGNCAEPHTPSSGWASQTHFAGNSQTQLSPVFICQWNDGLFLKKCRSWNSYYWV